MTRKKLRELEEEYQELLIESNGVHTEKIKELAERIDKQKEFIESEKLKRFQLKSEVSE